jgi:hypothetical protein
MSGIPVTILLSGLLTAASAWPQMPTQNAGADLDSAMEGKRQAKAFRPGTVARFAHAKPLGRTERWQEAYQTSLRENSSVATAKNGQAEGEFEAKAAHHSPVNTRKTGVAPDMANSALCNRDLLPAGAACSDATPVVKRLREASEHNRLPAFLRFMN